MNAVQNASLIRKSFRTALATALALLPLTAMNDAQACASCGCTLSKDWDTQGQTTQDGLSADLSYTYINQNTALYGSGKASSALINTQYAAGQENELSTKTGTYTATLNYNSDTWGVSVQVPYLNRTHATDGQTQNVGADLGAFYSTSSGSGIGDVRVIGRYSGFCEDGKSTGLIVGLKLPTGSTNATFNAGAATGQALDPGLQLGTGSTDIILGGFTSGSIGTYGWFVQGTVQSAFETRLDMLGNPYRPGDAYSLNTGIRYAGFGAKVSPMLQLNFIRRENDRGPDIASDPVTGALISGGQLLYLSPGVTVRVGGGTSVYGFVQVPVYQYVNSLQLVPKYTATLGVRQSF
jgi:hypothetical protein